MLVSSKLLSFVIDDEYKVHCCVLNNKKTKVKVFYGKNFETFKIEDLNMPLYVHESTENDFSENGFNADLYFNTYTSKYKKINSDKDFSKFFDGKNVENITIVRKNYDIANITININKSRHIKKIEKDFQSTITRMCKRLAEEKKKTAKQKPDENSLEF